MQWSSYSHERQKIFAAPIWQIDSIVVQLKYVMASSKITILFLFRKLYEPHLFPNASVLKIFKKHFGNTLHRYNFLSFMSLY